ncbi:hypothetical protein CENSYa_1587 [Cenarchaeum symbiosum A]|uniref:Uncharacterized protein n=1 Tax=Cenarchaeum symbiosum (strain A) TaxID=414004 RepID=A0RXZ0_CENSY|nr:hypothetical protein CENSYa_1587 [Cenarchaeum symbiosum A]
MQTEGAREERIEVFQCMHCFTYVAARDDPIMSIEYDNLSSDHTAVVPCKHCDRMIPHRALLASKSDYEKVAEDQLKSKK